LSHTVVDWKPHRHLDLCNVAIDIWRSGFREDSLATVAATNEPILDTMSPDPHAPESLIPSQPQSTVGAYELWQFQKQKQELRAEYLDHWEATTKMTGSGRPVDALISAVAPFAAPPHGKNNMYPSSGSPRPE
jgi:amidase